MRSSTIQQFVFGYGPLLCPHSRALTAPTLASKAVTPVVVQNVERAWAVACWGTGMTAMGVQFQDHAQCAGVLVPVDDGELLQFDGREKRYHRVPLYSRDVVPFGDDQDDFFLQAQDNTKVWMYLPKEVALPSPENPIVQSYVDTILRGCLTISDDFAEQFIVKTKGWSDEHVYWVDDRHCPIYKKGDQNYMLENGEQLDELLMRYREEEIKYRTTAMAKQ